MLRDIKIQYPLRHFISKEYIISYVCMYSKNKVSVNKHGILE